MSTDVPEDTARLRHAIEHALLGAIATAPGRATYEQVRAAGALADAVARLPEFATLVHELMRAYPGEAVPT